MQTAKSGKQQDHLVTHSRDALKRPHVKGKFFYLGDEKLWIRGVTYGTFRPNESGNEFHNPEVVERDFAQMVANGINAMRTYTVPPKWLLDSAARHGLHVLAGLPWEQHIAFLDSKTHRKAIPARIRSMIRGIAGHSALLGYAVGNEIPAHIVRWHGPKKIERFVHKLYRLAKKEDPLTPVTYVNYPTTEYLVLPFLDFHCYNVYLESELSYKNYLHRIQNIAFDKPLVMGEIGLDSQRNGQEKQAETLDWHIRRSFMLGCAGTFVFSWTDEWHRGGFDIEDWDFGLVDRERKPKPALSAVRKAYGEIPFPANMQWPSVSVVVCSYNGARTIGETCEHLLNLDYPDYEIIVVNDGSTDETPKIVKRDGIKVIDKKNGGLSAARNTGFQAANGEIVAYIDDDAYPDREWLKYLVSDFIGRDSVGVGGPNLTPPGDGDIAECIAHAPGGPLPVLMTDWKAEHIPGCNMAFYKKTLEKLGGFDPIYTAAGDDVDFCWRVIESGDWISYNPSAAVWHHRRNSAKTYLKQQIGYGKAEALLERKWPEKYNAIGHLTWLGRIYGNGPTLSIKLPVNRVYYGTWGEAPFQRMYDGSTNLFQSMPLMPEWYVINIFMFFLLIMAPLWKPLYLVAPILVISVLVPLSYVLLSLTKTPFWYGSEWLPKRIKKLIICGFFHISQPLSRLFGRICCDLTPWRNNFKQFRAKPLKRTYEIWSETWQSKTQRLETLEKSLKSLHASIKRGSDYAPWDLELRGGLFCGIRFLMTIEEHGAGQQMIKLRLSPRYHLTGVLSIILTAVLAVNAMLDHSWLVGLMLFFLSFLMTYRTVIDSSRAIGVCVSVVESYKKQTTLLNEEDPTTEQEDVLSLEAEPDGLTA